MTSKEVQRLGKFMRGLEKICNECHASIYPSTSETGNERHVFRICFLDPKRDQPITVFSDLDGAVSINVGGGRNINGN